MAPVTAKFALCTLVVSPVRETVKVNGVVPPLLASGFFDEVAERESRASSLTMVPVAVLAPGMRAAPPVGAERASWNCSLGSMRLSPAIGMMMVLLVSPGAKVTVPVGKTAPVKSAAFAGARPAPTVP